MISNKNRPTKKRLKLDENELDALVEEIVADGLPEGIFGVMDNTMDRMVKLEKAAARKPKKLIPRKPERALPKMLINKPRLPEEAKGLDINNVVNVPESMLRKIANNVDRNTSELNNLLLSSLVPLLLSYETGTNYAKAALRDGLNLEIDFDEGLGEAVKHIGYLNVIQFYVKRSRIPIEVKKLFIGEFAKLLAQQTLSSLVETNKIQDRHKLAQELQAVVYSGKQKKATVHSLTDRNPDKDENTKRPPVAVKRRTP